MQTTEIDAASLFMGGKRGRERGQNGRLMVVGKRRKMWRGHFYVYEQYPDGSEVRRHKATILGPRSEMTRKQAADALRLVIASRAEGSKPVKPELTFGQFWRERYLPMHQMSWKASSRATQIDNISRYCVRFLDKTPLPKLDRFQLQMIANDLAEKFSASVVSKFVTWTRAILEEAVEDDFIPKNPARKLRVPETRPVNRRFLSLDEISIVLSKLPMRERLIMRVSLVLGLRPGELFALRWNDIQGHALRLDESTLDGKLYPTLKTKQSKAYVALPLSVREGLSEWRERQRPDDQNAFLFPNSNGKVFRLDNYRADVLRPALDKIAEETGIRGVDFRACRRTCGTHLIKHGSVKEVQAHLRHSRATTTLDLYIQEIPKAVRDAVESLDSSLRNLPSKRKFKKQAATKVDF
jgi:integrase